MQHTGQNQSKNWKRDAMKRAEVISDAFEVFKAWLAHFANWILFFCLIGNILQTVVSLGSEIAGTLLCIQCVMLDIAGASLYTMSEHAKSQGNEKGARLAMIMSIILLIIMTVTALNSTLNAIFPNLSAIVQDINYAMIFARIVIVVAYGNVVHQLNTLSEMHDNRIEGLEQALSGKVNEVNALTAQSNAQLNALRQDLNVKVNEVNALRVKVNAQEEDLNALGVKLSSKEAQLASVKSAHENSLGAIQEVQSSVKVQLRETQEEVESLRSQLRSAQGSLHTEKQKGLTLTAENKDLNTQLNALTAQSNAQLNALRQDLNVKVNEVNALRVKVNAQVNAQEEDLNAQPNTTTDDLDAHKIVHLDTQIAESKNYESLIRSLLINEPGLSGGEIGRRLGCSKPTACYWKKLIENERKEA